MRFLEILLAGLLSAAAVCGLSSIPHTKRLLSLFLGLSLLTLALHVVLEGAHWQMVPAYLACVLFAVVYLLRRPMGSLPGWASWSILFLVLAACGLSATLPMFRLPRPTGPYPIGTRVVYMVDQSRIEDAVPGGRKRELMVQLWYPAGPSDNPYAPYRRRAETTLTSSYQSVLPTRSRWNAPVAPDGKPFPVLLFNPAWNGRRTQDTFLTEELASHGYVVAGIDHTYNSDPVAFPDGRVIRAIPVPDILSFSHSTLKKVRAAAVKEIAKEVADNIFVLNQLEAMNSDPASPLHGRLNVQDSGAFGHSIGGAVAANLCLQDPRIRAALDLDGSLFGKAQQDGIDKPFMFIEQAIELHTDAEIAHMDQADRIDAELDRADAQAVEKYGAYRIFLSGSSHLTFTDKAIFSPFASLSGGGSLPGRRAFRIIRAYAMAFFDQELKGQSSPLLKPGVQPYHAARTEFSIH